MASLPVTLTFQAPVDSVTLATNYQLETLLERGLRNAKRLRLTVLFLSVIGFAWATQAIGLSMPAAFCLFLGWLPIAWGGLWLLTTLIMIPREMRAVALINSSAGPRTPVEVTLVADAQGLRFSWDGGSREALWADVERSRLTGNGLMILLKDHTGFSVGGSGLSLIEQKELQQLFEATRTASR